MDNHFEKRINQEIGAQMHETDALNEALEGAGKVSEIVSQSVGERIPQSSGKSFFDFSHISQKITNLLFQEKKEKILPSVSIQKTQIQRSLKKEEKSLLRQAKKIQNQRQFSAAALEAIIRQIRYLRKLLSEFFAFTTEKIEQLYRQYVLKTV
jgi:hypothetical protein